MKINKSEIMIHAWSMFKNDTWTSDLEFVYLHNVSPRKATFSECLKEAWAKEKEIIARIERDKANAETSEARKAWDWACKKLDVNFEMDAYTKAWNVENMLKETWNGSIWSAAIKAVKLQTEIAA